MGRVTTSWFQGLQGTSKELSQKYMTFPAVKYYTMYKMRGTQIQRQWQLSWQRWKSLFPNRTVRKWNLGEKKRREVAFTVYTLACWQSREVVLSQYKIFWISAAVQRCDCNLWVESSFQMKSALKFENILTLGDVSWVCGTLEARWYRCETFSLFRARLPWH